ncbi:hypothetical protein MZD04_gp374 [Pseudomonas phage Psa21]|uniref:Uncharacterized protein n=1 Tax=Pseudomonas phage Psa21 TaxID=2530023 RepID=A0A481W4Z1_9CAUD|nr:hypothetical protein MZD04_gp374 [Pseudomonas phage Psa21]QBJ02900.1 hypothetical protein PSA21_374 [Pseudomonas phage Psa21]
MHVVRVCRDRMGDDPIGQVCEASKVKRLLWCPKGTSNTIADTADYHVGMMMAMGYVNEPEELSKFLRKLKQPAGEYYVMLWNVTRRSSDAVFEFDFKG